MTDLHRVLYGDMSPGLDFIVNATIVFNGYIIEIDGDLVGGWFLYRPPNYTISIYRGPDLLGYFNVIEQDSERYSTSKIRLRLMRREDIIIKVEDV